jgi:hypothetical protein
MIAMFFDDSQSYFMDLVEIIQKKFFVPLILVFQWWKASESKLHKPYKTNQQDTRQVNHAENGID